MKRLEAWLERHPLLHSFVNDLTFRGTVSIYSGMAVNLVFAVFKLISGLIYSSMWMGAIAVYYFVLCAMRGFLAWRVQRARGLPDAKAREQYAWKTYRLCGWSMLALQVGMTGMVVQMVRDNRYCEYPGSIIYLSALYAFYALTVAIINLVTFHRVRRPILVASKNIALAAAVMSLLSLQTALIARFGGEDAVFRIVMNSITGGVVCLFTLGLAIYMIIRSTLTLRRSRSSS